VKIAANTMISKKCKQCNAMFLPPKYACTNCGGTAFEDIEIDGHGKLLTFTIVRVAPLGFETQAPYVVGLIQLSNDLNVTGRLESKQLQIGDDVVFLKQENGAYWFSTIS